MRISVAEAKKRLTELLKAVEDGERVTICHRGVPVAEIPIHDSNWWKPTEHDFLAR